MVKNEIKAQEYAEKARNIGKGSVKMGNSS